MKIDADVMDEARTRVEKLLPLHSIELATGPGGVKLTIDCQHEQKSLCNSEILRCREISALHLAQAIQEERERKL